MTTKQKTTNKEALNKSLRFDENRSSNFIFFDSDQFEYSNNIALKDERKMSWDQVFDARVLETNDHFYKCIITVPWRKFIAWVPAFIVKDIDD